MNINYINESVISVAVMRRKHTHRCTHARPTERGQCGKDVCRASTKPGHSDSTAVKLVNDSRMNEKFLSSRAVMCRSQTNEDNKQSIIHTFANQSGGVGN